MARLTPDNEARARDLIALYPQARSALIPILHVVQEQDGYLSDDGMRHAAELLELAPAEVRGTASFYDMFHTEPIGKYLVAVCTNIACMLQGAYELLEHAEERLGVAAGGTTADGNFTLEDAECLALCGNAPCLTVNWRFFGDVDPAKFDQLVGDLEAGRLADEVPVHGMLSRVRRNIGLQAGGLTVNSPGRIPQSAAAATSTGASGPDGAAPAAPADTAPARTAPAGTAPAGTAPAGTAVASTAVVSTAAAGPTTTSTPAGSLTPAGRRTPAADGGVNLLTRATTPATDVLDGLKAEATPRGGTDRQETS